MSMEKDFQAIADAGRTEELARKLHEWYLEACREIDPDNFNADAYKSYDDLNDEQKFLDYYIAGKAIKFLEEN